MATGNGALLGVRVLLVADDRDAREISHAALETLGGASVTAATSAHEALAIIERQPPHVLVTDLALHDEDGRWLLDRIRALPRERGGAMPVVALTPRASRRGGDDTIARGFQARVTTPVEPALLCATVARVLQ
jgi:CheY-like chemotaxis protein